MTKYIHKFTVWKVEGLDMYSQPTWSAPIHVRGREEQVSTLFINSEGREERGSSRIYLEKNVANTSDHIVRGTIATATPSHDSKEIRNHRVVPNLRGTREEYRLIV